MRIKARIVIGCVLGLLLAKPVAEAQEAGRTYRLGLLTIIPEPADQASPIDDEAAITDAFLAGLHDAGGDPGEIPVEQPTLFDLWLNLKTAGACGIEIPPSPRLRTTEVIE